MKQTMNRILRSVAVAAVLAGVWGGANADVVYSFNATDVGAFGTGPYGTVTLHDNGTGVDFTVDLRSDMNFVNTGGDKNPTHSIFSFNATGVATTDIGNISFNGGGALGVTAVSPGANSPFGDTFSLMLFCTAASPTCTNGAGGAKNDPLTFTVANAEYSDFGLYLPNPLASFAADVICITGSCDGSTGAIGVTDGTNVPEPATLVLLGLGALGLGFSRRRKQP